MLSINTLSISAAIDTTSKFHPHFIPASSSVYAQLRSIKLPYKMSNEENIRLPPPAGDPIGEQPLSCTIPKISSHRESRIAASRTPKGHGFKSASTLRMEVNGVFAVGNLALLNLCHYQYDLEGWRSKSARLKAKPSTDLQSLRSLIKEYSQSYPRFQCPCCSKLEGAFLRLSRSSSNRLIQLSQIRHQGYLNAVHNTTISSRLDIEPIAQKTLYSDFCKPQTEGREGDQVRAVLSKIYRSKPL